MFVLALSAETCSSIIGETKVRALLDRFHCTDLELALIISAASLKIPTTLLGVANQRTVWNVQKALLSGWASDVLVCMCCSVVVGSMALWLPRRLPWVPSISLSCRSLSCWSCLWCSCQCLSPVKLSAFYLSWSVYVIIEPRPLVWLCSCTLIIVCQVSHDGVDGRTLPALSMTNSLTESCMFMIDDSSAGWRVTRGVGSWLMGVDTSIILLCCSCCSHVFCCICCAWMLISLMIHVVQMKMKFSVFFIVVHYQCRNVDNAKPRYYKWHWDSCLCCVNLLWTSQRCAFAIPALPGLSVFYQPTCLLGR